MTRQTYAAERAPDFDGVRFDPIAEGRDYGLSPDLLRMIWDRARAEASQGPGRLDATRAQQRFHELAQQAVTRQRKTSTAAGGDGGGLDELGATPGKQTLTEGQGRGEVRGNYGFDDLVGPGPGKQTLIEAEAQRQSRAGQVGPPAEEMTETEKASAPKPLSGVTQRAVEPSPEAAQQHAGSAIPKTTGPSLHGKGAKDKKHPTSPLDALTGDVDQIGEGGSAPDGKHHPPAAKAGAASQPKATEGRYRFARADLHKMLPPIGPKQTIEQRRNQERAALESHDAARAHAESSLTEFVASSGAQANSLRGLQPGIDAQLHAGETKALTAVDAAAGQQIAAVRASVAQAVAQAGAAAAAARGQIEAEYGRSVAAIHASTAAARQRIDASQKTQSQGIDKAQQDQLTTLGKLYQDAATKIRAAGTTAGAHAMSVANTAANGYRSQMIHRDDSFLKGPLTDNRCKARAEAAVKVGEAYRDGLKDEGEKQVGKLNERRPTDEQSVRAVADEARTNLDTAHTQANDALTKAEEQSIASAGQARTSMLAQIDSARSSTIAGLNKHGASQASAIQQQAAQIKAGIRQQRAAASAQVHQGIEQAIAALHQGTEALVNGLAGAEVPDEAALDKSLARSHETLAKQLAQMKQSMGQSAAHSAQGLSQAAAQGSQSLHQAGASAIAGAHGMVASARTSFSQIAAGGAKSLQQIATGYQTQSDATATAADTGFASVVTGLVGSYTTLSTNFEAGARKNADGVRDAFMGAVDKDMPPVIHDEAEKAAAKVQPRWKSVLKWVIIIAIILVVAIVIGPMVIGAVAGAAAALGASAAVAGVVGAVVGGALVGAAASALTTIVDNAFSGRALLEGVGEAAMWGAIGGAVGGAVSSALGPAMKGLSVAGKIALSTASDVVVDTAISAIQGNLSWDSFAQGLFMSLLTNGVTAHPKVEAMSGKFDEAGNKAGKGLGEKIRPPKVDMGSPGGVGGAPEIHAPKLDAPKLDAPHVDAGGAPHADAGRPAPPKGDKPAPAPTGGAGTPEPIAKAPAGEHSVGGGGGEPLTPKADGAAPKSDGAAPKSDGAAPKADDAKADGAKPKADDAKVDGAKPKADDAKADGAAPKADDAKADGAAPKADDAKADGAAPKADDAKADGAAPKADDAKADGAKPKADDAHADGAKPKADDAKADGAKPKADDAHADGAKPKADDAHADGQKPKTDEHGKDPDASEPANDNSKQPEPAAADTDPKVPVGPGGFKTDAISLTGKGDALGEAVKWLKPEPGRIDVVVHGDGDSFFVLKDGNFVKLDHRALANYIKKNGGAGQDIRLISCKTGESPTSIAQHLANKLGVNVKAPSDTVWVHPDGKLTIGKNPAHNTGTFNDFKPGVRPDAAAPHAGDAATPHPGDVTAPHPEGPGGTTPHADGPGGTTPHPEGAGGTKPGHGEEPAPRAAGKDADDTPPPEGLPPDLKNIRDGLSGDARKQFDQKFKAEGPDKLRTNLERMARSPRPLQDMLDQQFKNAQPKPPGDAVDRVPDVRRDVDALAKKIDEARGKLPEEVIAKYQKKLRDEAGAPLAKMESDPAQATTAQVEGMAPNIRALDAELRVALSENDVVDVNREIPSPEGGKKKLDIDVVADGGRRWIEVKNREPFGTGKSEDGQPSGGSDWNGGSGERGLKKQVELMQEAARLHPLPDGTIPQVEVNFPRGVSPDVHKALTDMGVRVTGEIKPVRPPKTESSEGGNGGKGDDGGGEPPAPTPAPKEPTPKPTSGGSGAKPDVEPAPATSAPPKGESSTVETTPKADGQTPKADSQTPKADSQAPKADSQAPKADSQAPKADSQAPKADSEAVDTEAHDHESSPPSGKTGPEGPVSAGPPGPVSAAPGTPDGITGGKVSHEDFLGTPATDADVAKAHTQAESERAMTLDEQAQAIATGSARSERDMLLAIQNGELPRFIARVGPDANFSRGTFANPNRPFSFAAEPADLRGLTPAEAMYKVGWTKDWIKPNIGKEIVICCLDTSVKVPGASGSGHNIEMGKMEWPELKVMAIADPNFALKARDAGIDPAELPALFDIAARTPVKGAPDTADPAQAARVLSLRDIIDDLYGANELYTGMGATMGEDGGLGGREIMMRPNGTGLKLTPDNHRLVSLGIMTQAQFDALFPPSAPAAAAAATPPDPSVTGSGS